MSDFANDATVRLRLLGTPYPALSLDDLPTIPRGEWVEVDGRTATEMLSVAEAKPEIPHEAIQVEVLDEGGGSPGDDLVEAVGEATAEDIAAAGLRTIEAAKEAADEELDAITGVGSATIDKIRSFEP